MDTFKLNSESRDTAGKQSARKLRSTGRIPAILYGHKETPVSLTVDEAQMRMILTKHPDSPIVDLAFSGANEINALVREVQRHPATGRLLHIDLQRISLDEQVRVDVSLELEGEPVGVKDQGGILEQPVRSLEVECLPREIPEAIVVNVAALTIGDSIKLADVRERYPQLVFGDDDELTLATVSAPRVEAVAAEGEEGAEEGAAEPELVSDKGDEDEESKES